MSKIYIGDLPVEALELIHIYADKELPDSEFITLRGHAQRGVLKHTAVLPEVDFVVLDDDLWNVCKTYDLKVMHNSTTHHYVSMSELKNFLVAMFGEIEDSVPQVVVDSEDDVELLVHDDFSVEAELRKQIETLTEKVSSLTSKNSTLDALLANVRSQLKQAVDEGEADTSYFVDEINSLNNQVDELKTKLKDAEAAKDKSSLEARKNEGVSQELSIVQAELESLRSDHSKLQYQYKEATDKVSALSKMLEELSSSFEGASIDDIQRQHLELETIVKDLEQQVSSFEVVKATLDKEKEELQGTVNELKAKLADKDILAQRVEELEGKIASKDEKIGALQTENHTLKRKNVDTAALQSAIDAKESAITTLNADLVEARGKLSDASEEIKDLKGRLTNLQNDKLTSDSNFGAKLDAKEERIRELEEAAVNDEAEISDLKAKLITLTDKLTTIEGKYNSLKQDIKVARQSEEDLSSEKAELSKSLKASEIKVTRFSTELTASQSRVTELEGDIAALQSSVEHLTEELNTANEKARLGDEAILEKNELSRTVTGLDSRISSLSAKVETLRQDGISKDAEIARLKQQSSNDTRVVSLQDDLAKSKATIASLQEELTDIKTARKSDVILLEDEVGKLREQNNSKTGIILGLKDQIAELTNSVFMSMADCATPKSGMILKVHTPQTVYKNMYVFASGSSESEASLYALLNRQVKLRNTKSYLIVDLANQTYIDREMGVNRVVSPVGWLQGANSPVEFLTSTKWENVKLLATSLSYINELSYLTVDWTKRLEEIASLADIVIINVGTLGSTVPNILYNSFTRVMRGHIIVKSTPISLRTSILHLSGLLEIKNTMVTCVSPSPASEKLYATLASKWSTQTLQDSDVLIL